jgi:ribosomal-protein-alanine N-acetyltransferase
LRTLEETDEVEVLFLLGKAFWGQGLATEAAAASLRYGCETAHLGQIIALVLPGNLASQRVIEKLGMTCLGQQCYFEVECVKYLLESGNTP